MIIKSLFCVRYSYLFPILAVGFVVLLLHHYFLIPLKFPLIIWRNMKFLRSKYGSSIDSGFKSHLLTIESHLTKALGVAASVPTRHFSWRRQRNTDHLRPFNLQPSPKNSKRHMLRFQLATTLAKVRNQYETDTNSMNGANSSRPGLALDRFKFPLVEIFQNESADTKDTDEPLPFGAGGKSNHKTCMTVSTGLNPSSSLPAAFQEQSEPTSSAGSARDLATRDTNSTLKCCTLIILFGLTGGALPATEISRCLRFQYLQNMAFQICSAPKNPLVHKGEGKLANPTKRQSVEFFALLLSNDSSRAVIARKSYEVVAQKHTFVSSTSQTQVERGAVPLSGDFLTTSIGLWERRRSQARRLVGFIKQRALLIVSSALVRSTLIQTIDDEFSLMARSADAVLDFQNRRHLLKVDQIVQQRLFSNYGKSAKSTRAKIPEWWQMMDQEENTLGLPSSLRARHLESKGKAMIGKHYFYHELEALIPKPCPTSKEDIKASAPKLKWNWRLRIVRFHGDHDPKDNFSPSLETAPQTDTRRFRPDDPPILVSKTKHDFKARPLKPCLKSSASFGLCKPMMAPPPTTRSRRSSGLYGDF